MKLSSGRWSLRMVALIALITLTSLTGMAEVKFIQFDVSATAMHDEYGYTAGESYTFTWLVNSAFMSNDVSWFTDEYNYWSDEVISHTPTFTDVKADGLTGSWQRPTVADSDPCSFIFVDILGGSQRVWLYAGNERNYSIGFQAGGTDVRLIQAWEMAIGDIFTFPESYTDPNEYFAGYVGTYPVTSGSFDIQTVSSERIAFTPTSLTITAIPEPSAALLTLLGLAALRFRRRPRHPASR
jgi:hypothetical protein